MEKMDSWAFWRRRCAHCRSRRLKRTYSTFSTARRQSMGDLIGEMRRLGPVHFVPGPPPGAQGPPPGGCPFAGAGGPKEGGAGGAR